jgi:hypothetical protein
MFARLEHWSLCSRPLGLWRSPEDEGACLFGLVAGHPRHRNGKEVITSPVIWCSASRIVTRSGSEYELGSADPAYEERYPGALQRLLARLQPRSAPLTHTNVRRRVGWISRMKRCLRALVFK